MDGYFDALSEAMRLLGERDGTVFVGQQAVYEGTAMQRTLKDVPLSKRLEFPVAEELQMGFCLGLALTGLVPISMYPRWNFLILAANQLVNHVDKIPEYGNGYQPKVIVRVGIGGDTPLHPGPQHLGDFTQAFRRMLDNVAVIRLEGPGDIVPAYVRAMDRQGSTLIVEELGLY